jgi:hypothetical protein
MNESPHTSSRRHGTPPAEVARGTASLSSMPGHGAWVPCRHTQADAHTPAHVAHMLSHLARAAPGRLRKRSESCGSGSSPRGQQHQGRRESTPAAAWAQQQQRVAHTTRRHGTRSIAPSLAQQQGATTVRCRTARTCCCHCSSGGTGPSPVYAAAAAAYSAASAAASASDCSLSSPCAATATAASSGGVGAGGGGCCCASSTVGALSPSSEVRAPSVLASAAARASRRCLRR